MKTKSTLRPRVTVIGAGPGGLAMAAHLAARGHEVCIYDQWQERIEPLLGDGRIGTDGVIEGVVKLTKVTSVVAEAVQDADIIIVVMPAHIHAELAKACASHLKDGQSVVLCPGRLFGAVEFARTMQDNGLHADVLVAETNTIPHTCRCYQEGSVSILAVKSHVRVAAFPANRTHQLLGMLQDLLPVFDAAADVLETGLNSIGAILHPAPTLLNIGWIETKRTQFKYYYEGITPSIAEFIEQLDNERLAVAKALGVRAISTAQWLHQSYGAEGNNLYEVLQNNECYRTVEAPSSIKHRYLLEDVPTGLVPIASLGQLVGEKTPIADLLIDLACRVCGVDFRARGRTLEKLGLDQLTPEELQKTVRGGR